MRPFYLYLMKFRQPKEIDSITKFANYAYEDHGFPKQSTDYNELSSYLELNADYLESMSVFDQAWEQYVQIEEGLILGDQE
ncbi:YozE family protein [Peribacillus frigoritolerans]|uniref:YozE family protein n=1 Tax=Peribacillus frigoritolerans TaxID=450367 RepID=UPI002B24114A|nr:YozE family protein [Peribacillus frigoritolerans]MEB2628372.1 YozE family protein [Peribacillus frigoritolerans]